MAMVEGLFSASSTFVQGLLTPMSANKSKCHTTPLRAGSAEEVEVEEEKEEGEDDEELFPPLSSYARNDCRDAAIAIIKSLSLSSWIETSPSARSLPFHLLAGTDKEDDDEEEGV